MIEFLEDNHVELYNLKDDLAEQNDLALKMPDKAKELRGMLDRWRKEADVQMPRPNPQYVQKVNHAQDNDRNPASKRAVRR